MTAHETTIPDAHVPDDDPIPDDSAALEARLTKAAPVCDHDPDVTLVNCPGCAAVPAARRKRSPKPAIRWRDEPLIVLVNEVIGSAAEKASKGGLGAYVEVAEADREATPPDGPAIDDCTHGFYTDADPTVPLRVSCPECHAEWEVARIVAAEGPSVPGCTVRVIVPKAADAYRLRSQLGSAIESEVEESVDEDKSAALYLWVPGLHGRVGTYTNHRCHELLCRAAWRQKGAAMKQHRRAQLEADPSVVPHGLATTYTNWLCRGEFCDGACTRAWNADAQERKQRALARRIVVLVASEGGQIGVEHGADGVTDVRATLPTVGSAEKVAQLAIKSWDDTQIRGCDVTFEVGTQLAVDLKLGDGDLVAT